MSNALILCRTLSNAHLHTDALGVQLQRYRKFLILRFIFTKTLYGKVIFLPQRALFFINGQTMTSSKKRLFSEKCSLRLNLEKVIILSDIYYGYKCLSYAPDRIRVTRFLEKRICIYGEF